MRELFSYDIVEILGNLILEKINLVRSNFIFLTKSALFSEVQRSSFSVKLFLLYSKIMTCLVFITEWNFNKWCKCYTFAQRLLLKFLRNTDIILWFLTFEVDFKIQPSLKWVWILKKFFLLMCKHIQVERIQWILLYQLQHLTFCPSCCYEEVLKNHFPFKMVRNAQCIMMNVSYWL